MTEAKCECAEGDVCVCAECNRDWIHVSETRLKELVALAEKTPEAYRIQERELTAQARNMLKLKDKSDKRIAELEARVKELEIELMGVLQYERCNKTSCPIPTRAMCSNPMHESIRNTLDRAALAGKVEKC